MNIFKLNPKYQIFLLLAVWLAMGCGDWFMRFYWFEWQRNWLRPHEPDTTVRSSERTGVEEIITVHTSSVPGGKGGDLTRLIGIPAYSDSFEQERVAYVTVTDSEGFYSPYCATQYCPVVVVGDSFMVQGQGWTNTFAGQLAGLLGVPVRNRGIAAKGAVMPLVEYLDSRQFKENPPVYVVYGLLEREMTRRMLAGGMVFQLWMDEHPEASTVAVAHSGCIRWGTFHPDVLKWQLPNSSMIAKLGKVAWNIIRYYVFDMINPEVVVASSPNDRDYVMLCYRETIALMHQGAEARGVDQIIWALQYLNEYLDRCGVKLVLVLIPDKAQVYRTWLPEHYTQNDQLPPSCLWEIEDQLLATNVAVVNLLQPYREIAERDELLYWRDDTHWNGKGIRVAAELTAESIRVLDQRTEERDAK